MSTRIVILVEGGTVYGVYSNSQVVDIDVLDRDNAKVGEGNPELEEKLEKEIQTLNQVY